ncbi:cysteine desulfurase family protein [Sandaracinobacteroides saxicola]|uniref:Cysteine desulfurase n=1 Tax=Sandaracinobacteroides saxicola TaxID=2759707 RepID=A0A7G5IEA0_9SPHN|nr:cysteine desulfurase family protein [Sandaracinobacteroides saxicola]QMW21692.1 cysteine desulfurase [Sandaracinobacteroides saxicola]
MIDLDVQATTPLDPAVLEAMLPWLRDHHANPHSPHRAGRGAKAAVEVARAQVAAVMGVAAEWVVFTGGATEANNLALKGVMLAAPPPRRRLVTFATEHSCVLVSARWLERVGFALTVLPVLADGQPDLMAYAGALGDDVALVSAMLVNNEIGSVWPIAAMAEMAHGAGALMHSDAAQGFGKVDASALDVDLLSVSGHKIYGPKGVGALLVRPGVVLEPVLHGGGQERFRSGTLSPALCVGLGAAARLAGERMTADAAHVAACWEAAMRSLHGTMHAVNGGVTARWLGNLSVRFPGVDASRVMAAVPQVMMGSGAACSSAAGRPSHVLAAIGLERAAVRETVRLGWGRFTGVDEVERAMAMIVDAVRGMA